MHYYFGLVLIRIIRKHHDRYIDIYENATAAPSMIAKGKLEGVATAQGFFSSHALLRKNERKFFLFCFWVEKTHFTVLRSVKADFLNSANFVSFFYFVELYYCPNFVFS